MCLYRGKKLSHMYVNSPSRDVEDDYDCNHRQLIMIRHGQMYIKSQALKSVVVVA